MSKYIDADALGLELAASMPCVFCVNPMHNEHGCDGYCEIPNEGLLQAVRKEISDSINSAPAVEIRHGKWEIEKGTWGLIVNCSECGARFDEPIIPFSYCPACGADMRNCDENL